MNEELSQNGIEKDEVGPTLDHPILSDAPRNDSFLNFIINPY